MIGIRQMIVWAAVAIALTYCAMAAVLFFGQRAFLYPAPEGEAGGFPGFKQVSYTTADGLTLTGGYHPADDGKPTLLFFHGNGTDWVGGAAAVEPLAAAGYGVLSASYRGYRTNPGSPSEQGLYRDARAAHAWLLGQGIDAGRVIIVGNSVGSGVAVQLASETDPAGLILISPFNSLTELVGEKFPWLPTGFLLKDRYESASKIGQIAAPVLILHGDADTLIPSAHGRRLATASTGANLQIFAAASHDLAWLPQAQVAQAEWLAELSAERSLTLGR
jgi:fermentation-respiration switch protein FrsA (DUF1100 family)